MAIVGFLAFSAAFYIFLGKILPLQQEKLKSGWLFVEDEAALKKHITRAAVCLIVGLLLIVLDLAFYF